MLGEPSPSQVPWQNAQTESIAVHARCLTDFFNGAMERSQTHDDVLVRDYSFTKTYSDPVILDRSNKDIAHLTYSRIERYPEQSTWRIDDLQPLLAVCEEFVIHLLRTGMIAAYGHDTVPWLALEANLKSLSRQLVTATGAGQGSGKSTVTLK